MSKYLIRPHHMLCMQFFEGKGYSDGFVASMAAIKEKLEKELNPEEVDKDEKEFGEIKFREQDRVMQTKNNYNLLWEKDNDRTFRKELGNGIFNGELGIIDRINKEEKTGRVKFDDGKMCSDFDKNYEDIVKTVEKTKKSDYYKK